MLTAQGGERLFVPEGFAHGFRTIEPNTAVQYCVNRYYSREHDRGVLWNDPELGIDWRLSGAHPLLSDRDQRQPVLARLPHLFSYRLPVGATAARLDDYWKLQTKMSTTRGLEETQPSVEPAKEPHYQKQSN